MIKKCDIMQMYIQEIEDFFVSINQPKYRAKQVFEWIHKKRVNEFEKMSNLPKDIIGKLNADFYIPQIYNRKDLISKIDNTRKFLYEFDDKNTVETVYMPYNYGNSLCISTQVGCKMGCTFCASTIAGFERNLSASEMLQQVYQTEHLTKSNISNIVLMGIGEPLDNFDNVVRFLKLVSDSNGRNISLRNVTISTCGLVDKIMELAEFKFGLTLALSLHAPNNNMRNKTMPINKRYNIQEVINACKYYADKTKRRITFEYALIEGENDDIKHAKELSLLIKNILCHVNLIPVNKVEETGYTGTSRKNAERFAKILESNNITCTIRRTLGADINAACGQLRKNNL